MALRAAPDPERERRALIAAHLQRLVSTQEWEVFVEHVEEMERGLLTSLRTATKDDVAPLQGRLLGIAEVMRLPGRLIAQARRP